ncbi:transcriptional regulator [Calothrix sp. HK-06]|nr:transcriptional regulator [Calothrix sp. HK-06]
MDINQTDIEKFVYRTERMYQRWSDLLHGSVSLSPSKAEVLPQALMELGSASQTLQLATEELCQQNQELAEARNLLETERQRYKDLFDFAPDAYLVTDLDGKIQEANRACSEVFGISQQNLMGKLIVNFVTLDDRHKLRCQIAKLSKMEKIGEIIIFCKKREGGFFNAALTATSICNRQGIVTGLRWLIRDITEQQRIESTQQSCDLDLSKNRPLHKYCKREVVPLGNDIIWYVKSGIVKLSSLCEAGTEILLGLVREGMVFGASLTTQQIYQVTAISDVELVPVMQTEITASPALSHVILPKIKQRLQQTEYFLAIAGRLKVEDRFWNLLQYLKQDFGQHTPIGTRINIRFTHEELAGACCTTRVTITRLVQYFQQRKLISLDNRRHIIIHDDL